MTDSSIRDDDAVATLPLVAFLDNLGTKEMLRRGDFSDAISFDYVNAAGVAARLFPSVKVAAFSDSVLVSASESATREFVCALAFMHRQWFSDGIVVRGGIAVGEIHWVTTELDQGLFDQIPNFLYARVFGQGVVNAKHMEERSGPGALCFLSATSAERIRRLEPAAVLDGPCRYLVWASPREIEYYLYYFGRTLDNEPVDSDAARHFRSTLWYFNELKARDHRLPHRLCPEVPEPVDDAAQRAT